MKLTAQFSGSEIPKLAAVAKALGASDVTVAAIQSASEGLTVVSPGSLRLKKVVGPDEVDVEIDVTP